MDRIKLLAFRFLNVMDSYLKKNTSMCPGGMPSEMGDQSGTLIYRDKLERILDEYSF